MQGRLTEVEADLAVAEARLARTQERLRSERARLARLKVRLADGRELLAEQLVAAYKADEPDIVSLVIRAHDFADLIEQVELAKRVQERNGEIVDRVHTARDETRRQATVLAKLEVERRDTADGGRAPARRARQHARRARRAPGHGRARARGPRPGARRHARRAVGRREGAEPADRRARAGGARGGRRRRAGRAVGDPVADRAVRVGRPEPAAQQRRRVRLLPDAALHLEGPRRLHAARLPGVEGRAGPPRRAPVGRRRRRAQLGLRRAWSRACGRRSCGRSTRRRRRPASRGPRGRRCSPRCWR